MARVVAEVAAEVGHLKMADTLSYEVEAVVGEVYFLSLEVGAEVVEVHLRMVYTIAVDDHYNLPWLVYKLFP